MRKILTFLCAALMSVSMFAEPTQQDLSLNYTEWEGAGGSISLASESMLKCTVMEAPGGMELRWNAGEDFSGWDKIVIEVHSMTNCDGNYYRLLGYLRDASGRTDIQKQGQVSTILPGDEPAMITIDLRRKSALGDFDLTQVHVLGIQSQVAGSEFVIKRAYLEKSNIPFDPEGTLNFVELTAEMVSEWENDETIFSAADLPGFGSVTPEQAQTWSPTDTEVSSLLYYDFEECRAANYLNSFKGQTPYAGAAVQKREDLYRSIKTWGDKVYYTTGYTNKGDEPEPEPEPEPQPEDVNIIPNADPDHAGVYYSTFYDSANKYALPDGVEAYIVTTLSDDVMQLQKVADAGQTIPAGAGVILKATVTPFTLTPSDADAVSVEGNRLDGSDVSINTPANCYVLAGEDGVGFYHYTASMLNPHKAYIIYAPNSGNQAPRRLRFAFETATGVEEITNDQLQITNKVLENGVLYIIKNGVKFNAQGQIVK